MTILLRTKMQKLALKLPSILCILAISLFFFTVVFDSVNAQIGRPGDDVIRPIPDPDPVDPGPDPDPDDRGPDNRGPGDRDTDQETPPKEEPPIVIGDGFLDSLYGFIVIFGGKLVGMAGDLLNRAVGDFVIGFGDVYLTWGVGVAVENAWKIIRDVLNITFIFAIVYIGIRLIFDANDSSAKRSLGFLLAAALLINFSLFISKFVVDFSNSLAAVIYNTGLAVASENLAASFINLIGLSTIVNNGGTDTLTVGSSVSGGLAIVFGTFIFMLLATYALAAGAFLIFVRGIALIFFMIFSPVMFLGWIFPQFRSFTSKYWSMFLSNAFMAPAYIFCVYLTFAIMDGFKYQIKTEGGGNMGNLFAAETYAGNVNALVVFTLAIGMMLASISVAKKMGAFGGGLVVSVGNGLKQRAVSGVKGVGKMGIGAGGAYTRNRIDNMATSNNAAARALGRGLTKYTGVRDAADKAYKSSPQGRWKENRENRGKALATRTADARAKQSIGDNATGGGPALERSVRGANQTQIIDALRKHDVNSKEYRNIVGSLTQSQITDLSKAKDDEFSPQERNDVLKTVTGNITKRITPQGSTNIDPTKVPNLTFDELETLGDTWVTDPENLILLTNSQIEKLAKDSKVLGTTQKATLKDEWKNVLKQNVSTRTIENVMKGRSPKEIAKLPGELLADMAAIPYLSESVLKEIAEAKMPQSVLTDIETNMKAPGAEASGKDYLSRPTNKHRDRFW